VVTVNPSPKVFFSGSKTMFRKWQFTNNNSKSNYRNGNLQLDRKRSGNFWATPSGTNTIPTQTLVNLTTNPLTVTYMRQPLSKIMVFLFRPDFRL
jgi:hypothetical protein